MTIKRCRVLTRHAVGGPGGISLTAYHGSQISEADWTSVIHQRPSMSTSV